MNHILDRKNYVTATDIANLNNKGQSTWLRIKTEKLTGESNFKGNAATEWGKEREPVLAAWGEAFYGVTPNSDLIVLEGTKYAATPDGVSENRNGEYKTTSTRWELQNGDDLLRVRPDYYDQVQWAMMVTGASECLFAWEYHEQYQPDHIESIIVVRDEERIEQLKKVAEEFLEYLQVEEEVGKYDLLIAEWVEYDKEMKVWAEKKTAVEEKLRELLADKDSEAVKLPFASMSYYHGAPQKRFSTELLAEKYPDIQLKDFYVTGATPKPTLKITPKKD